MDRLVVTTLVLLLVSVTAIAQSISGGIDLDPSPLQTTLTLHDGEEISCCSQIPGQPGMTPVTGLKLKLRNVRVLPAAGQDPDLRTDFTKPVRTGELRITFPNGESVESSLIGGALMVYLDHQMLYFFIKDIDGGTDWTVKPDGPHKIENTGVATVLLTVSLSDPPP